MKEEILEFISRLCVTYTMMGIMCVVFATRMSSENPFAHKSICYSPVNEHLLFTSRICGHKKIMCIVTQKTSVITFLQSEKYEQ
jgi:hypothetical protein